jgi:hypothetical protein
MKCITVKVVNTLVLSPKFQAKPSLGIPPHIANIWEVHNFLPYVGSIHKMRTRCYDIADFGYLQ